MLKNKKNLTTCLLFFLTLGTLLGQGYTNYNYTRTRSYPLPQTTMDRLGEAALKIAQQRLAKNANDKMGLLLLSFANHFIPTNREVLLVRGKLKFKVPLKASRREFDEKEFLTLLCQARDHINNSDTAMNRHILAILNQMIRVFNPTEEDAIIALMKFSDKGVEIDVNKLLSKDLDGITDTKYDPKDSRYAISNVKKTLSVTANTPWTDTWIKVKAGKMIKITAYGIWSMGNEAGFPACDADGYKDHDIRSFTNATTTTTKKKTTTKTFTKSTSTGTPGCLLAKIGTTEYYVGKQRTFKADTSGILYLGPYEWGDYLDNYGKLDVTVEIYD